MSEEAAVGVVAHTSVALIDKTGLRFSSKRKHVHPPSASHAAASAPAVAQDEAHLCRTRMLDTWADAAGGTLALHNLDRVDCEAALLAADAAQEHLVVEQLATPMGTYPSAMLRVSDLLSAELRGDWRLSCQLPPRPAWIDMEPPEPPERHDLIADDEQRVREAREHGVPAPLEKYFVQRYMLFSRYDAGVALDEEGWYSVTPEVVAQHMAERCRCDLILDAFCGVGGNAIQFAFTCERVVAVDLDAARLRLARHNSRVYEVDDRIEWLQGDFFALAPGHMQCDVVFLSPPWGGPEYAKEASFDLVTMMGGLDGAAILRHALRLAPSVAYFLPRNADVAQVEALALEHGVPLEIERVSLNGHEKGLMAYFGFEEEEEEDGDDGDEAPLGYAGASDAASDMSADDEPPTALDLRGHSRSRR